MKRLIFSFVAGLFIMTAAAQQPQTKSPDKTKSKTVEIKKQIVDAACGECQFGLKGKSCDLAIRINGKAYFVDGTNIDDHGDAHAEDGFCEKVRKAEVTGTLIKGRFTATSFKLLPEPKKANK